MQFCSRRKQEGESTNGFTLIADGWELILPSGTLAAIRSCAAIGHLAKIPYTIKYPIIRMRPLLDPSVPELGQQGRAISMESSHVKSSNTNVSLLPRFS